MLVLNAAVAAFYYLRVVVYMYMREPRTEAERLSHGRLLWAGLAAAFLLTVAVGLFPTTLIDAAATAAQALPQGFNPGVELTAAVTDLQ
jgi:NADH-quinone oxidoreductase subunit N